MSHTKSNRVLILQPANEMRRPYATALRDLGCELTWFHNLESFMAFSQFSPLAVIVDIDILEAPVQNYFQSFRSRFPDSVLFALSGTDSSQTALQCIRSGFSDFLVKPISPEALSWTVRKALEQRAFDARWSVKGPDEIAMRALRQLTSAGTTALVHWYTIENMMSLFKSAGAAWMALEARGPEFTKVICSTPRSASLEKILFEFPYEKVHMQSSKTVRIRGKARKIKLVLPCRDYPNSVIYLWSIRRPPSQKTISISKLILEQAHTCLLNLRKFDEVRQQTFIDDLTGLYNSRYLRFSLTGRRNKGKEYPFSLLFIDVDHFKLINDRYGHVVGSAYLVTIGRTIRNAIRNVDPVFRYGGDEFVVLLNQTGSKGSKEIAERIRQNIERRTFMVKGLEIRSTVSIGVAAFPEHTRNRETLLKLADEAMYSVKRSTRNAVHLAYGLEKESSVKQSSRPRQHQ